MSNLETKAIEELEIGEFFKRKTNARKVYTRQQYNRSEKRYGCDDESDISNEILLKKGTKVFVGFDY